MYNFTPVNEYKLCDWLWENPPVTQKDNFAEKCNSIIQSIISPEGLKLQACNLQFASFVYIALY